MFEDVILAEREHGHERCSCAKSHLYEPLASGERERGPARTRVQRFGGAADDYGDGRPRRARQIRLHARLGHAIDPEPHQHLASERELEVHGQREKTQIESRKCFVKSRRLGGERQQRADADDAVRMITEQVITARI